ncbi:restriction endonuclease subunit S [Rhodococcus sp. IEGM 1401]|uniref:restriction endonuclease subunit S n=1 Tax=unclassified Rhodococcus (in: high G+C Gram-positive bacteria) TaxID=192944 RepID=UPI0022B5A266|nr:MULTISPECIES: restriction endonuclease subunit S [unclassified Rhodococcus (in: high G+C Gram-positive bacteria)]MCZ4563286.1 restriction endonuclease subunit S [Rhodococcus sp. IEGM 1401]MDI9923428.1 restriction endonuclease subunit S [Rhodococcus sp. IEGM 1372]MDV8035917.1 restriction endonuclease subunit S [Rhodococcus sp. IEGM 1414]
MTLMDVSSELVDCVNRTAPETPGGEYFLIGTPAMRGNVVNINETRRVSAEVFAQWTRRLVPIEGDLLLAREAPVGPVVRVPAGGKFGAGQRTTLLRANPEIVNPLYLFYLLIDPTVQARLIAFAMGSTVPHLRVADVKSFPLPELHSIPDQNAIANLLSSLDSKIQANSELVDTAALLSSHLIELSPALVELSELATVNKTAVTPEEMGTAPILHYSLPAFDAARSPAQESPASILSNKFRIDQPCVLISKLNPRIPRVWDIPEVESTPAYCSTEFVVLESDSVSTSVLTAALRKPAVFDQISSLVAGTSGSHQRVKPDELLSVCVRDPRTINNAGLKAITALGHRSLIAQKETATLRQLRDTLLPALMSGKISIREGENYISSITGHLGLSQENHAKART